MSYNPFSYETKDLCTVIKKIRSCPVSGQYLKSGIIICCMKDNRNVCCFSLYNIVTHVTHDTCCNNYVVRSFFSCCVPGWFSQEETRENATISELSFVPTTEDDGKSITCRAENPNVTGLFLETSWKINVVCECSTFRPVSPWLLFLRWRVFYQYVKSVASRMSAYVNCLLILSASGSIKTVEAEANRTSQDKHGMER